MERVIDTPDRDFLNECLQNKLRAQGVVPYLFQLCERLATVLEDREYSIISAAFAQLSESNNNDLSLEDFEQYGITSEPILSLIIDAILDDR